MCVILCTLARSGFSSACRLHSGRGSRSVSSRSSCRYFSGGFLMRKRSCAAIFPATTNTQAVCAIVSFRTSGRNRGPAVTKKPARSGLFALIRSVALEIRRDVVLGAYHSRFERRDERIRADLHQARSAGALLANQRRGTRDQGFLRNSV